MNTDTISKAARLPERELIAFAKSGAISKAETYELIDRLAQAQRARGETREIAVTKFMTEDPCGRELYAAYRALPVTKGVPRIVPANAAEPTDGDDAGMESFRQLCADYAKANPGATKQQALDAVLATAAGRAAFQASKSESISKQLALQQ